MDLAFDETSSEIRSVMERRRPADRAYPALLQNFTSAFAAAGLAYVKRWRQSKKFSQFVD